MRTAVLSIIGFIAVWMIVTTPWKHKTPGNSLQHSASTALDPASIEAPQGLPINTAPHNIEERHASASSHMPSQADKPTDHGTNATTEDRGLPCECREAWQKRKWEQLEARRWTEPKDPNWAFETEQILEQYIGTHHLATRITNLSADCRTRFCDVVATVPLDSRSDFHSIVMDAVNSQWSTFDKQVPIDWDNSKVREHVTAYLSRKRDPARWDASASLAHYTGLPEIGGCECATPEWEWRKAAHDIAVREAEEKDPYWAYAQEALIARTIADHPDASSFTIESIDCRTTYCDIKATAMYEVQPEKFLEMIMSAAEKPGAELKSNGGMTVDPRNTIQKITGHLRRDR